MYKLVELPLEENGEKNITEEYAVRLIETSKLLGIHMRSFAYYQIVKRNLCDFLTYIYNQQGKMEEVDTIECNRWLYNFVDTFYSFINYYEKNYKSEFAVVKKQIYDTYFEYRFIYNLRNYMVHQDLGVLKKTTYFNSDKIEVDFKVSKSKLQQSTGCQKPFARELKTRNDISENISIKTVVEPFVKILLELQKEMLIALSPMILEQFKLITDCTPNQREVYLTKDGAIVNGMLNVSTKYYAALADDFVYDENLMLDLKVKEIFMKFSRLYYGQEGVIYNSKKLNHIIK